MSSCVSCSKVKIWRALITCLFIMCPPISGVDFWEGVCFLVLTRSVVEEFEAWRIFLGVEELYGD